MKPFIPIVAPRFLDLLGHLSPLGVGGIGGITIFPFVFTRIPLSPLTETHEGIHILQQVELALAGALITVPISMLFAAPTWLVLLLGVWGFLPFLGYFYILYGIFYLYWGWRFRGEWDAAYYMIPFEVEAFNNEEKGLEYLWDRHLFAWTVPRGGADDRA